MKYNTAGHILRRIVSLFWIYAVLHDYFGFIICYNKVNDFYIDLIIIQ